MKKLTDDQLDQVRDHLDGLWAERPDVDWITVEYVAKNLNLKLHIVKQAFQKLNLEGLLSTPDNTQWVNSSAATIYWRRVKT